jgi:hypothetical protein
MDKPIYQLFWVFLKMEYITSSISSTRFALVM